MADKDDQTLKAAAPDPVSQTALQGEALEGEKVSDPPIVSQIEEAVFVEDAPAFGPHEASAAADEPAQAEDLPLDPSPADGIYPPPSAVAQPLTEQSPLSSTLGPPPQTPPEPSAPPSRGGGAAGFLAALLGGAIALGAGFGLSHFNLLNLRPAVEAPLIDLAPHEARLGALEAALAQAKSQIASQETSDFSGFDQRLQGLEQSLDQALAGLSAPSAPDLSAEVTALTALVAQLRQTQPSGLSDEDIRQIITDEIDARAAEALAAAKAEADAASQQIIARAERETALQTLQAAKANGQPFAEALAQLQIAPDQALSLADKGLPRLADLQAGFAAPAREALAASLRHNPEGGLGDRVWSFLRIQSGARSLTPQEGNDPDAILSRAEAALAQDDIASVLSEISALPAEGQAPLAQWAALAKARLDALDAIDAILAKKE